MCFRPPGLLNRVGDGPSTSRTEAEPAAAKAPIKPKTTKIEIKLPFANDGSFLENMKLLEVSFYCPHSLSLLRETCPAQINRVVCVRLQCGCVRQCACS